MLQVETWVHGAAGEYAVQTHAGTNHHLFQQDKEHKKHMLHAAVQVLVLPFPGRLTAAPQTEQLCCILVFLLRHVYR